MHACGPIQILGNTLVRSGEAPPTRRDSLAPLASRPPAHLLESPRLAAENPGFPSHLRGTDQPLLDTRFSVFTQKPKTRLHPVVESTGMCENAQVVSFLSFCVFFRLNGKLRVQTDIFSSLDLKAFRWTVCPAGRRGPRHSAESPDPPGRVLKPVCKQLTY